MFIIKTKFLVGRKGITSHSTKIRKIRQKSTRAEVIAENVDFYPWRHPTRGSFAVEKCKLR